MNFITLLDYVGTFAFAISGIRLASAKHFDWFGAYVVGFVTAVGGGTLRDLLLGLPPFWMQNVSYLVVSGFAFLFVVGLRKYVIRLNNTFFIFDAVGLGLFTVVGIQKSIAVGYPMWVGIIMGTLTGAAGGMLRDVLLNEVPLIFRKDIYAIACICGGLIYYLCMYLDLPAAPTQFIAACSVILIRILTVRHLPSGTQGRNQTGTQREITNRFRNTGPAVASTTRQFRRPAERDRIAKKNYGSYSAATDDGRLISAVSPPTKRSRSCGAIRICNPRTPALI